MSSKDYFTDLNTHINIQKFLPLYLLLSLLNHDWSVLYKSPAATLGPKGLCLTPLNLFCNKTYRILQVLSNNFTYSDMPWTKTFIRHLYSAFHTAFLLYSLQAPPLRRLNNYTAN